MVHKSLWVCKTAFWQNHFWYLPANLQPTKTLLEYDIPIFISILYWWMIIFTMDGLKIYKTSFLMQIFRKNFEDPQNESLMSWQFWQSYAALFQANNEFLTGRIFHNKGSKYEFSLFWEGNQTVICYIRWVNDSSLHTTTRDKSMHNVFFLYRFSSAWLISWPPEDIRMYVYSLLHTKHKHMSKPLF